jgi:hypothetical protein
MTAAAADQAPDSRPGVEPEQGARTDRRGPRHRTYDDLDLLRCHQLLAAHHVGRVAWSAADGPQLFPISYAWVDGIVVFRTSAYGILSELVRRTPVVFEVDDIDQARRRGWSVIIRGRAAGIASPDDLTRGSSPQDVQPWAGGNRNLVIAVSPQHITGRTFYPVDDVDPFP